MQGWYYLSYQQVYKKHNIIMDRTKRVQIQVDGTRLIFDEILTRIEPLTSLWDTKRWAFFSRICSLLQISVQEVTESILNKFGFDPFEISSWESMNFTESQVYMFSIGQIWENFYVSRIELAYLNVSFSNWDLVEGKKKLAYEFSMLSNLLYVRELGKLSGVESMKLEALIDNFKPFFENDDLQGFQTELEKIRISLPKEN